MTAGAEPRAPGVVELREDVPLKGGGAGAWGAGAGGACAGGGLRAVVASFAALTAAITLALLVQVYAGVGTGAAAHGAVAAGGGARCSRAGAAALRAGGGALDAAAAAAMCLVVAAPHATSLDASGALLLWRYRTERGIPPLLVRWGAVEGATAPAANMSGGGNAGGRAPRLVCALAALHAARGGAGAAGGARLPWKDWIQPALDFASEGIPISGPLSAALSLVGSAPPAPAPLPRPRLAAALLRLQNMTADDVLSWCGAGEAVTVERATGGAVNVTAEAGAGGARGAGGRWLLWAPPGPARALLGALAASADPAPSELDPIDAAIYRASLTLNETLSGAHAGPASGLAVVDSGDVYVALVTGLSVWFGSEALAGNPLSEGGADAAGGATGPGEGAEAGWVRDEPVVPLDLAPAMLVQDLVCGTRFVLGAESSAALAQGGAGLAAGGAAGAAAVERARLAAPGVAEGPAPAPGAAPPPHAALNVVLQRGDTLASHADSRGAGLASRF
ncbi:fibroin heavy chain [Plutella xylostella]|uniref:fibroin heavy chain n=1 Tax=Plutella xylostella TaxID=51655 RepID=UPI00203259CA|nr:fibroin heavy chain [Plutella xylostella]